MPYLPRQPKAPLARSPVAGLPRLLKAGTVVEFTLEHAMWARGATYGSIVEPLEDCGGNCERSDDGNFKYSVNVSPVISGAHLKKVRSRPHHHVDCSISSCTAMAIDEFRDIEPDHPTLPEALDRLVKMGLEAAFRAKEETLLALLTRVFKELDDRLEGSPGSTPPPYMDHLGRAITEVEFAIKAVEAMKDAKEK